MELRGWSKEKEREVKSKRRRHDPGFKAKVALEAVKGIKTVQQIAAEFEIHPQQVTDWKRELQEQAGSVFSGRREHHGEAAINDVEKERLHAKVGELTLHVDFLKKKCRQLGIATD